MLVSCNDPEVYDHPFKHVIYRDVIKTSFDELSASIDDVAEKNSFRLKQNENFHKIEVKSASGRLQQLLDFMASDDLAALCAQHFNIPNLEADPSFDGGGLTITGVGKYLRYHYDFPYSNSAKGYRVVNALLYLSNPKIKGGNLHLLDPGSGTVEASIEPFFGTLAIFATSGKTPHGVSRIFGYPRVSINSYFYAQAPLDERYEPSKTEWIDTIKGMNH